MADGSVRELDESDKIELMERAVAAFESQELQMYFWGPLAVKLNQKIKSLIKGGLESEDNITRGYIKCLDDIGRDCRALRYKLTESRKQREDEGE